MDLPGLPGYAGDGRIAQAPRRPGVGLNAVAELDRLGGSRHAPDGGGGVQVVTQLPGVQALPPSPLVAHGHDIGDEHMVVDLGIARPGGGMAWDRPGEPSGGGALLRSGAPAARRGR